MSAVFDCNNIRNNKIKLLDIINNTKGDNVLISLSDLSFKELISFLHVFSIISEKIYKRVFAGIPVKYEYIKLLLPNSNYYILKNNDINCYLSKFQIIIKLYKNDLYISNNYTNFILNNIFNITEYEIPQLTIKHQVNNVYSDIIGLSINDYSVYRSIVNELLECSLLCEKFEFSIDDITKYDNTEEFDEQLGVKIFRPKDNSIINNVNNLITKISNCRYFIGNESDLSILSYMILGNNNFILLDSNTYFKSTFPFIKNVIDVSNNYKNNSITDLLNELYCNF